MPLSGETNFRVRNCHICNLKTSDLLAVLVVFSWQWYSLQFNREELR